MGWALIGCTLWRRWPPHGSWIKAEIVDYNRGSNMCCLKFDKYVEGDRIEWIDLRELEKEEISHIDPSQSELKSRPPIKRPPERNELSQLLTPPPALRRTRGGDSSMDFMSAVSNQQTYEPT